MSDPEPSAAKTLDAMRAETKKMCEQRALYAGLRDGCFWFAVATAAVVGANTFSPAFKKGLNISAKTALAWSPGLFMFFFSSEQELLACNKRVWNQGKEQFRLNQ